MSFQVPPALPLMKSPSGGFPVPGAIAADQLPPAVQQSIQRIMEGPPKPAVTLDVMNQTQYSMLSPDLPFLASVPPGALLVPKRT